MDDRRNARRVRTFLRGQITLAHRLATMDCIVRDLSSGGARLALTQHFTLPDRFDLAIPHREVVYKCQLRWRRPNEVGVLFDIPADAMPRAPDPAAVDLLARMHDLEHEIETLRRRLAEATTRVPEPA